MDSADTHQAALQLLNGPFHRDLQSSANRPTNQELASLLNPFVITFIGSSDLLCFTLLKSSFLTYLKIVQLHSCRWGQKLASLWLASTSGIFGKKRSDLHPNGLMPCHLMLPHTLQSGASWWTSGPSSTIIKTSSTDMATGVALNQFHLRRFLLWPTLSRPYNHYRVQTDLTEYGTRIRSWLDSSNNSWPAKYIHLATKMKYHRRPLNVWLKK